MTQDPQFAKGAYLSTPERDPASQTVDRTSAGTLTRDAWAQHHVGLRKNLGRWTIACRSCAWTEIHYDETTAYREAARHEQTMRGRSYR